jgi:hypothetical protein
MLPANNYWRMRMAMRTDTLKAFESANAHQDVYCPQKSREQSVALERRNQASYQLRIYRRRPVNARR